MYCGLETRILNKRKLPKSFSKKEMDLICTSFCTVKCRIWERMLRQADVRVHLDALTPVGKSPLPGCFH
jgi:hypothetical protein